MLPKANPNNQNPAIKVGGSIAPRLDDNDAEPIEANMAPECNQGDAGSGQGSQEHPHTLSSEKDRSGNNYADQG